MSNSINDQIPELNIERIVDGTGEGLILLEQDSTGNISSVAIHPIHLRYMAEKFGLIESTDVQAQKTITMLRRRLLMLNERVAYLADYLANYSDHKHADLMFEMTYARATADLSGEYCVEFDEEGAASGAETQS